MPVHTHVDSPQHMDIHMFMQACIKLLFTTDIQYLKHNHLAHIKRPVQCITTSVIQRSTFDTILMAS